MTLLALLFVNSAFAFTQEPSNCLKKLSTPCLIQSTENDTVKASNQMQFHMSPNAIVRINHFPSKTNKALNLDVLSGQLIVENNDEIPLSVNSVGVGHKDIYYIKKEMPLVKVYKSFAVDLLKITRSADFDSIESQPLANAKVVAEFIGQFNNPKGLYQLALQRYESRAPQRKVANEKTDKDDADTRQIKKIKEMFFMRTFER